MRNLNWIRICCGAMAGIFILLTILVWSRMPIGGCGVQSWYMREFLSGGRGVEEILERAEYFHNYPREVPKGKHWDVCVVGAGLSGAVLAERYANMLKKSVLVIEKRDHIGGNCFDYVDKQSSLLVGAYGAHVLHTNSERVWNYINKWSSWVGWDHEARAWIKGKLVPIPININSVNSLLNTRLASESEMDWWIASVQEPCSDPFRPRVMPGSFTPSRPMPPTPEGLASMEGCKTAEQMALNRVGRALYEHVFKSMTEKQWGTAPRDLDPEVTAQLNVRRSFDARSFDDRYQAMPSKGYSEWFAALLNSTLIDVALSVDFFNVQSDLQGRCKKTMYTGPIDRYFSTAGLDKLHYRSIHFERVLVRNVGPQGFIQPAPEVVHPGPEVGYVRSLEYKHFPHQQQGSSHSVLVREYPRNVTSQSDPFYPVPDKRNKDLYAKYLALANKETALKNTHFIGRLANYEDVDMGGTIDRALSLFTELEGTGHADVDVNDLVVHVIASVFKEGLGWVEGLCKFPRRGLMYRLFLFSKSENRSETAIRAEVGSALKRGDCTSMINVSVTALPNVGREGHSFLTYMMAKDIGDINIFLQGSPEVPLKLVSDHLAWMHLQLQHSPLQDNMEKDEPAPPWHLVPFRVMEKYGDGQKWSHLLGRAKRMVASFWKDMEMPYAISSSNYTLFYRAEWICTRINIERMVKKHGKFLHDTLLPKLALEDQSVAGYALEVLWFELLSH